MDLLAVILILILIPMIACLYDPRRGWTHSCWGASVTILCLAFFLIAIHSQNITYTHKTEITDSFEHEGVKIQFDKPVVIETISTGRPWTVLSDQVKYRVRDYKPLPWNK